MKVKTKKSKTKKILATVLMAMCSFTTVSQACTRVVFHGDENQNMTGRTMDWKSEIGTNLWIFPAGIERNGAAGENSIEWISKYGSVIASGYDIATTDGMNEKGLVANVLWLVESEYPELTKEKKTMSLAIWAQYILDNFATVDEAVTALEKEPFIVLTDEVPGEARLAKLHLAISDKSGDSAIIEYIDGKQVIYHNRDYQVLTNSPAFDQQLAINDYWKGIGGTVMLPGTNRAADRFVRASFYTNAIPKNLPDEQNVFSVLSVVRNVSVPFGITTENEPNISSTRWRTVSDQREMKYYFESALMPNLFWVDFSKVDFSSKTGQIKKLDLGVNQANIFSGEVSDQFKTQKAFTFLAINVK